MGFVHRHPAGLKEAAIVVGALAAGGTSAVLAGKCGGGTGHMAQRGTGLAGVAVALYGARLMARKPSNMPLVLTVAGVADAVTVLSRESAVSRLSAAALGTVGVHPGAAAKPGGGGKTNSVPGTQILPGAQTQRPAPKPKPKPKPRPKPVRVIGNPNDRQRSVEWKASNSPGMRKDGKISWFGGPDDPSSGPTTASGLSITYPGVAVYRDDTIGGWWRVHMGNKTFDIQQTDKGPAPWTGRVMDFTYTAVRALGYTEQNFPTDSRISAVYLGRHPGGS
jgi:hypothetical protein